jgi:esterase/lipase superfamily enzyme
MFSAPVFSRAIFRPSAILFAAGLLAGCGTDSGSEAAKTYPSDIADQGELTVVTTRKSAGPKAPWYGSQRADASVARIKYVSPYHAGRLSMASAGLADWKIAAVEPQPSLTFAGDAGGPRDVLVYVHGFNATFERAALDAARLSDALKFRGDTLLFSWPSRDSVFDYMADRESAVWSRDALEDVLNSLLSNQNVGRVHIVAHSMGSMLAVEALRQVQNSNKGNLGRFGAIVFASPDIDVDSFSASVRRLGGLRQQMTVISAKDDRALAIAAGLAGGKRVGRTETAALEQLGIKVVDASGMSGGFLQHDTFLHDTGVQKIVIQAIADARNGTTAPSSVPLFEPNLPVTQEPLAAVPAPAAAVAPAPAAPAPAAPTAAVPAAPAYSPAAAPAPAPAAAPSPLY